MLADDHTLLISRLPLLALIRLTNSVISIHPFAFFGTRTLTDYRAAKSFAGHFLADWDYW